MMGFWWGFVVGLFIGANVGIVAAALCRCGPKQSTELEAQ